jgi:signal transduction histidine kinase
VYVAVPVRRAVFAPIVGRVRTWPLPAALTLLGLLSAPYVEMFSAVDKAFDVLGLGLVVVAGGALAGRRRWPVPTLVVVTVSTTAYLTIGYPYGPIMFCFAVAIYGVARRRPLVPASTWCLAALAVLLVHLLTNEAALPGALSLLPASAWVAVPFTLGVALRLVAEARERERREIERRIVDGERLRLAQEVHDVVGHGLAAIQMQADIALHLRQTKPDQAEVALEAISRASADALAELRATLATITPAKSPTPGLSRIDELRRRVEDAGVIVDLQVHGQPRKLPAAVDVAAYRVLQESLTNVVKHSSHPKANIEIAYRDDKVSLAVSNQDLLGGTHTDGFGITGMRRRVAHLGGQLDAGPGPRNGTFEVRATIPAAAP